MPPKKKTRVAPSQTNQSSCLSSSSEAASNMACTGPNSKEVASNANKGVLTLPIEVQLEILEEFLAVGPFTSVSGNEAPVLGEEYLARTDALRALSQVCLAYRRVFLPTLWESLNACCNVRGANPKSFFKHVGDTLVRKCDGLSVNPALGVFIRTANVLLTRYQTDTVIPKFSKTLQSLPNLHTLHVLHTHSAMTSAIRNGFESVEIPSIRTVIAPGNCHEILRCCPNVTAVWCTEEDGSKLVTVIAKYCKAVEEMRGFCPDEKMMKRIIKAVPNLRVFEGHGSTNSVFLPHLPAFKKFNTYIINKKLTRDLDLQKCIQDAKAQFDDLPSTTERRHIRILWRNLKGHYYEEIDLD